MHFIKKYPIFKNRLLEQRWKIENGDGANIPPRDKVLLKTVVNNLRQLQLKLARDGQPLYLV